MIGPPPRFGKGSIVPALFQIVKENRCASTQHSPTTRFRWTQSDLTNVNFTHASRSHRSYLHLNGNARVALNRNRHRGSAFQRHAALRQQEATRGPASL